MSSVVTEEHQPILKYVYNHDFMSCTAEGAEGVLGNYLYCGRALGITNSWDIIQMHSDLKPLWSDISAHYSRIGLHHSNHVIWTLNFSHLNSHAGYQPSVYILSRSEYRNSGDFDWYQTVTFINSKNHFIDLATELEVNVPMTLCFESVLLIDDGALSDITYPCYLKDAVSMTGLGVYRCKSKSELMARLDKFALNVPVQIQEEVRTDLFLNLQYRVVDNELIRLVASEQILDGYMHKGNRVPARYQPWDCVEPMAVWLKDHGIKDIFAFDVAAVKNGNNVEFFAIECNPRFNGASYPTLIAQKLDIPEWSASSYYTKHRSLKNIDLRGIEFDKKTGEGVIIVNWGTVLVGKLLFLLAGSQTCQDALKVELAKRLC